MSKLNDIIDMQMTKVESVTFMSITSGILIISEPKLQKVFTMKLFIIKTTSF